MNFHAVNSLRVFLLLFSLVLLAQAKQNSVTQLFNVQRVKVKKEMYADRLTNYGYIKANEGRVFDIAPRFGGFIVTLHADKIYQKVKKGEPLATVYSPEVFKAKDEYLNSFQYFQKRASKGMLESAKEKLLFLGINEKEIDTIIKKKQSSNVTTIYSPIDGYVFVKNITHGSAFNAKQKLFQIVNLDSIWVESRVFQEQLERLGEIDHFVVSVQSISQTFESNTSMLYPELSPQEATARLRLTLDNHEHKIFPGMYATITGFCKSKEYLTLPSTAVIRKNNKYYAFAAGEYEGEYEPKEINVTRLNAHSYNIISGLSEGEEVVNNALFMIDSDAQINGLY